MRAWSRASRHGAEGRLLPRQRPRFGRRLGTLFLPTETHRGQALHEGHAAFLWMIGVGNHAALGAQLVLRRYRQFLDARHPRSAHGGALWLRRDEGARCRRRIVMPDFADRFWEERGLRCYRPGPNGPYP